MLSTSDHPPAVPTELGSADAKLVYLAIAAGDHPTARELAHTLDLSKLTLYPILRSLLEAGYAERTEAGYATC